MANCQDCIHYKVCYVVDQMTDLQEYKTAKDLKDDCEACILTADVVPKREVDKTIAEWAYLHADTLNKLENSKAEVAREIFAEIENTINNELQNNHKVLPQVEFSNEIWNRISGRINALQGIRDFIAELKEKYTEDQT